MSDKVLFVDDEPVVLEGYQRLLGRQFDIETAVGGPAGIAAIAQSGPFAVVVSDMRMPQMDGPQFLTLVRALAPDSVRMALTGYADIDTAMAAVNEGQIFRFMMKPCSKETLQKALESGFAQHRLITAEKDLLEGTLRGCVAVLCEMLSFSNPAAFGRAMRLRRFVQQAAYKLYLKSFWNYEIAAMLSQLGCVTLSQDLVNSACAGRQLSDEDREKFDRHPAIAGQMLSRIPRMEAVAQMIACQEVSTPDIKAASGDETREIEFGIQLLRTGLAYDALLRSGKAPADACQQVRATAKGVDPSILAILSDVQLDVPLRIRECQIHELAIGMIIQEDLYTDRGLLLVAKGQELSMIWIKRLKAYAQQGAISKSITVQMPSID